MDRDELAAWLRLLETPQVGRESARKLLAAFGSPQAVLAAATVARREVVSSEAAAALDKTADTLTGLVEATLSWLGEASVSPRRVLTLADPDYPSLLLQTADPPLLLYLQGDASLLNAPGIGIVGSRNPTPQG